MNFHRNKIFIDQTRLPLLCEKSAAILLVLVGHTAGRPAVRQNTDRFEFFMDRIVMEFNEGTVLL